MNETLRRLLANATRLTRTGHLAEATQAIQRALSRHAPPAARPAAAASRANDGDVIDVEGVVIAEEETAAPAPAPSRPPASPASPAPAGASARSAERPTPAGADGAFISGHFGNAAGSRHYRLYVPPPTAAGLRPLIVMLHGCQQNPEDFAAGTRMNELAREAGCYVLYPAQSAAANGSGCWNWFREEDQQTGRGEPSILAEMTREVMRSHPIDAARVYVAGLSAGGAMAATLAATYPDLYAAVGVHSGLPHGAATDVASAFAAMSRGSRMPGGRGARPASPRGVSAIVFHGDQDTTVHACNGEHVAADARAAATLPAAPASVERHAASGGRHATKSLYRDGRGGPEVEHWLVHGGGHAWFGGSGAGSYTDPSGPDASREMLRFFSEHPKAKDGASSN